MSPKAAKNAATRTTTTLQPAGCERKPRRPWLRPPRKLQIARRAVQTSVVLFIAAVPILGHYGNYLASRELDALLQRWKGSPQGAILSATDAVMRGLPEGESTRAGRAVRHEKNALQRVQILRGNAWSAQIGGVSFSDPLAAAESFAASRRIVNVMLVSLMIPLAVTLLLGRVYCSWLCPMGFFLELASKLRSVLRFLELPAYNLRFPRATKYLFLACGLALAAVWALPVLGSLYPPAIIGREVSGAVAAMYDRAEAGRLGWTLAGFSLASLFLLGIVLVELLVSKRWWCRFVCPGGALYALCGRFRPLRVKRDANRCTSCGECVTVCGMGLAPMRDQIGMECDNCGLCISHCDDKALSYRLSLSAKSGEKSGLTERLLLLLPPVMAIGLLSPASACAHHILGIPHYAYDESYPQAPVITYRTEAGPYEVKMTGYPGRPVPGERTSLHVYIRSPERGVFTGDVTLSILRDGLLDSGTVVYGPVTAQRSEGLHKFFPTFDREDNYLVRIDFHMGDVPWTIDLPIVVGEPGSPVATLGWFAAGVALLLAVVRAARIKQRRRARRRHQSMEAPAGEKPARASVDPSVDPEAA